MLAHTIARSFVSLLCTLVAWPTTHQLVEHAALLASAAPPKRPVAAAAEAAPAASEPAPETAPAGWRGWQATAAAAAAGDPTEGVEGPQAGAAAAGDVAAADGAAEDAADDAMVDEEDAEAAAAAPEVQEETEEELMARCAVDPTILHIPMGMNLSSCRNREQQHMLRRLADCLLFASYNVWSISCICWLQSIIVFLHRARAGVGGSVGVAGQGGTDTRLYCKTATHDTDPHSVIITLQAGAEAGGAIGRARRRGGHPTSYRCAVGQDRGGTLRAAVAAC